MTRKIAAIAKFNETLTKLRSARPYSAAWVAAESNLREARWILSNLGVSETEITELARGQGGQLQKVGHG